MLSSPSTTSGYSDETGTVVDITEDVAMSAASLSTPDAARRALDYVLNHTDDKANSEAWFLVTLVCRGMGSATLEIARESERSEELVPRIRRVLLWTDTETAASLITAEDLSDDPVGRVLLNPPGRDRLECLQRLGTLGTVTLSAEVWIKHEQKAEGFWASLKALGKSDYEIRSEYLKRMPPGSRYEPGISKRKQFSEYLRFAGFGQHNREDIDKMLLQTFVLAEGGNLEFMLLTMWQDIKPDEKLLNYETIRDVLFTRCRTVFAAVPRLLASSLHHN